LDREFVDGRLQLQRLPEEREPILQRLRRIEGQVRGLQQMLEQDRYCIDELQQINAIQAAMREVSLLIVGQHVSAGIDRAVKEGDIDAGVEEIRAVLRALMRQP
jgi:CsoR family transcriptional regulator, copper-sensing transcriptional repressor